jgi:EcsC protein family
MRLIMSEDTLAEQKLSAYEAEQMRDIALWKSQPPNPLSEMWRMIVIPVAALVERIVPDSVVRFAIERAYDASALLATVNDIRKQSGVRDLAELRDKPLEECDRLSKRTGLVAESVAALEGIATGLGGMWTTALDVPLVFVLALRTIIKVGHCYGYTLDQPKDRPFVLGILLVASSGSLETRRDRLSQLKAEEDYLLADTQMEVVKQEILSFLFQLEVFEEVPGIGAVTGGYFNLTFLQRIELTARRIFQERWLIDTGKIQEEVSPADVPARQLAPGWGGAIGRAAYGGGYFAGYAAGIPIALASALIPSAVSVLGHGLREGARDAIAAVGRTRNDHATVSGTSKTLPALA